MPPPTAQPAAATFPHLSDLENRLFEAFAAGCTTPAALAARVNLPVKTVLVNLASPAFVEAVRILDALTAQFDRHTTRFRQLAAFQALEQALSLALAANNATVACRIATQLLRPVPPLPDAELESAQRAEKLAHSRRAVNRDSRDQDDEAKQLAVLRQLTESIHRVRMQEALTPPASRPGAAPAQSRASASPAPAPTAAQPSASQRSAPTTPPVAASGVSTLRSATAPSPATPISPASSSAATPAAPPVAADPKSAVSHPSPSEIPRAA